LILLGGLLGFETNFFQHLRLPVKLRLPCGKFVDAQHKRQNVGVLLACQAARLALRHGLANAIEEIAKRQTIPIGLERTACQCWRGLASCQQGAVAGGAFLLIDGLAALGLLLRVNTVPD